MRLVSKRAGQRWPRTVHRVLSCPVPLGTPNSEMASSGKLEKNALVVGVKD